MRTRLFAIAVLIASVAAPAAAELPRRGVAGLGLAPAPDGRGLIVQNVFNPDAGAVKAGDRLLAVNGVALGAPGALSRATVGLKPGAPLALSIERDGAALPDIVVPAIPAPPPQLDGRPVELGDVTFAEGARARTFFAAPADDKLARRGKWPAVMILQGIPCAPSDAFQNPNHPYTQLFSRLTAAGFAVVMTEKPGIGDSEGESCFTGGFDAEVAAYRAGAKAFASDPRIDAQRFFLVGISLGGIQAPLVAQTTPAAGIITWGTGVTPWYDYLLTTFGRRSIMQNTPPAEHEKLHRAWRAVLAALMVEGLSPEAVKARMPEAYETVTAGFEEPNLDAFAGRSLVFHREIDRAPVYAAWRAFTGRLLSLHGEYDWVSEAHDHRLAADIVNNQRTGAASFVWLPKEDHAHTTHASLAESYAKFGQGAASTAFFEQAAAWLRAEAER